MTPLTTHLDAATLAERLGGSKNGNGYTAHCPAHDDEHPSLSIKQGRGGKVLVKCHAGCSQDAVIEALRGRELWPARQDPSPATGCTIEALATAKHLDPAYLRGLGLDEWRRDGTTRVRIPYLDAGGHVTAVHYRQQLGPGKNRFTWRKGDHASLYGLDRADTIQRAGWVLLVEGESDCWTLWHHGVPALGLPGKGTWQGTWAKHLAGLEVYVWVEPDAKDLPAVIGKDVPDLRIIAAPTGYKDVSEAHILGEDIPAIVERLKAGATSYAAIKQAALDAALVEITAVAEPVLADDDPLERVEEAIRQLGYGGDIASPLIVYLAATTRLLELRPGTMNCHLLLRGPSSAGKSWTVSLVRRLLPPEAVHVIDAGSPRVLIYDDVDLRHRLIVFGEADSLPAGEDNPAASAVRNLLADNYLHYVTVIRDEGTGKMGVQTIDRPGPTVMVTTAVKSIGDQLGTRLFELDVPGDPEQYRAALKVMAELEMTAAREADRPLIAFQAYLQALAPWRVVIPFAPVLAEVIGKSVSAPRIMRDYLRLLSLIKAVTILRHRGRTSDADGRLEATLADYDYVRGLVGKMYSESVTGLPEGVRKAVGAVARLRGEKGRGGGRVTALDVAQAMGWNKMLASRRVNAATRLGYLVNTALPGHPKNLIVGDPLPDREGLPELVTNPTIPDGNGRYRVTVVAATPDTAKSPGLPGSEHWGKDGNAPVTGNAGDVTGLSEGEDDGGEQLKEPPGYSDLWDGLDEMDREADRAR